MAHFGLIIKTKSSVCFVTVLESKATKLTQRPEKGSSAWVQGAELPPEGSVNRRLQGAPQHLAPASAAFVLQNLKPLVTK